MHQSPDSSFTGAAVEEELQELKNRLSEEEANNRILKEQLQATEQQLREKESAHTEQVILKSSTFVSTPAVQWLDYYLFCLQLQVLQAVVCEKDVRFQEQIQKHEEELLRITTQAQSDSELQQVF